MRHVWGCIALTGFVLAAAVHLLSLAGVDLAEQVPSVWGLHFGLFVVFIPFVFASRKTLGNRPSLADLRTLVPGWVFFVGAALFIYAVVNFVLFAAGSQGGSPSIREGKYVLLDHGHVIKELSHADYAAAQANLLRGFSGHWLLFYYVPFAYFLFAKKSGQ